MSLSSPVFVKKIAFHTPPPLRSVFMKQGQRYEYVGFEEYQGKRGEQRYLLCWKTYCPECFERFITQTGLKCRYANRRCPKHHAPGGKSY